MRGFPRRAALGRGVTIAVFALFFASASPGQTDAYTKWSATYIYNPAGMPVASVPDGFGNVYITGSIASESVTIKYDSKGNTLWRAFLDAEPANDPYTVSDPGSALATGLSVALDAQGNVYVLSVLFIPNDPVAGPPIIATAKYNSSGVRQWVDYLASTYKAITLPGAFPDISVINAYYPSALAVSPAGNAYTAFYTVPQNSNGQSTANVIKYDTDGHRQWLTTASATPFGANTPQAIGLDASENIYLLVNSMNQTAPPVLQDNVSAIFKFNSHGTQLASFGSDKLGPTSGAQFSLIGPYSVPYIFPFQVDAQGNSYFAGTGTPNSSGVGPRIVAKFNSSGALDWLYTFSLPDNHANGTPGIVDIAVDPSGNVFVAQTTDLKDANPPGSQGTDIGVNKFEPNGNLLWSSNYNGHSDGSGFDGAVAIAVDSAGSSYVTGQSGGTVETSVGIRNVLATIKYDSDGNQVWAERYQPDPTIDYGPPNALTASGSDVFVTGLGGVIVPPSETPNMQWLTINYGQDALEANPAVLNFGNQTLETPSDPQTVTLTNITSTPYVIKTMNYTVGNIHFTTNCPDTMNPGESCQLFVTFTPSALGALTGTIIIRDTSPGNAIAPETITVEGTGTT
jgi:hypothetical protein